MYQFLQTIDALKQQLLYKTLELESVKAQANEETINHKQKLNQLIEHLSTACKERDEARDQIQKLLKKYNFPAQIYPSKANSSITESNSLSDTYNYQSPNDPFFDIVSSPDSSNLGNINNQKQQPTFVVDKSCLVIDALVKGKKLPHKGKLLQTVLEAGPLLKTLFIAGPLPSWRNPPTAQGIQIPPASVRVNNMNLDVFSIPQSGSLIHFNNGPCAYVSDYGSFGKRQRLL